MHLKIAVVEDDTILREELSHFLRGNTFEVSEVLTGLALDELLENQAIDLIILDLNLPGPNGFEIAKRVKSRYSHIGIVMLTARTSLPDRIKSYDSGADIYLPKPTSPAEILAAVNSLGRRLNKTSFTAGWSLHVTHRTLQGPIESQRALLTAIEQNLLLCLARAPDWTMDAQSLCENLSAMNLEHQITRRALENLISRLRKKIAAVASNELEFVIRSVRGVGYQLCMPLSVVTSH